MAEANTQAEASAWMALTPRVVRAFLCRVQAGVESPSAGRGLKGGKTVGAIVPCAWHVP